MPEPRPAIIIAAHGMQWTCVPEFAAVLPLLDIERSRHPDALPPEEFVKDNTVRTVMRMHDPLRPDGPGLYLKRYKFRDAAERLKHLLLPAKPVVEWRASRVLRGAGIPTCEVLAIAVRRQGLLPREGFLVSREIAGTVGLTTFLRRSLPDLDRENPAYRHELIEELAALTAALADRGFCHRDYHAGNLLIRPDARAGERLFVVDQHSFRRRRPWRSGVPRMLAMLGISVPRASTSDEDRTEFLGAFLSCWKGGPGASDRARASLCRKEKRTELALRRRNARSRTRRCIVRSSLFTMERTAGFLVHRRRDFPLQAALGAVRLHRAAMAGNPGIAKVLRRGHRTEVTLCRCDAVPPLEASKPAPPERLRSAEVCVKSFLRASAATRLKDLFLRLKGRARTVWIASHGFQVRGAPAARPLALLESRSKHAGMPDYMVMEALENDGSLATLAAQRLPAGAERRELGKAVADLLGLLAREEVYHPDTKPSNVLVQRAGDGFRLWLVDLDRATFGRPLTRQQWQKCLARLNAGLSAQVSVLDRMRCLRECSRGRWTPAERLRIARAVYRLSLARGPVWLASAR